jgi:hypothetical protein
MQGQAKERSGDAKGLHAISPRALRSRQPTMRHCRNFYLTNGLAARIPPGLLTGRRAGKGCGRTVKISLIQIPCCCRQAQNYPNPFNASTTIRYSLEQDCRISLTITKLRGETIMTLFDGFQKTGAHAAVIDGGKMASGVYLVRLQSGFHSIARKMLLLR